MTLGYAQGGLFFATWDNICCSGRLVLHVMLYTVRVLLQEQDTEYMKHQRIILGGIRRTQLPHGVRRSTVD